MTVRFDDLIVGRWDARFQGRAMPCAIGRGGISALKREGDGVSPAGAYRLLSGYWRADRMARPVSRLPLSPIGPGHRWSDDPSDPDYNRWLRAAKRRLSSERMARADPLYDIVLASDFNSPDASPGGGSAIFVHIWKGPRMPTAGCAAFRRDDLLWILAGWRDWSRLVFQP